MRFVVAGGLLGLTWACGLRGVMATLAGADSTFTWTGTYGLVLAPGVAVGAILGWAEHARRTGGRRRWRWAAASPMLFSLVLTPTSAGALRTFLQDGIGGGALAVPLFGMLGGYAISGRAPRWLAIGCAVVLAAPLGVVPLLGQATPEGMFLVVAMQSMLLALALACSVPHRPLVSAPAVRLVNHASS